MPVWEAGQSPQTDLDKYLTIIRDFEMKQMVTDALKIRSEATSVTQTVTDLEAFHSQIKNLAIEVPLNWELIHIQISYSASE